MSTHAKSLEKKREKGNTNTFYLFFIIIIHIMILSLTNRLDVNGSIVVISRTCYDQKNKIKLKWITKNNLSSRIVASPFQKKKDCGFTSSTINNMKNWVMLRTQLLPQFLSICSRGKLLVVKLWTYHFYSTAHNLSREQVLIKVVVEIVSLALL